MVARVDWPRFQGAAHAGSLPPLLLAFASQRAPAARRAFLRAELEATPLPLRRRLLQKLVRSEVIHVLGAAAEGSLGDRQGLAEAGIDSLQAIDVKNRLSVALGTPLPSTLLFDQPSVQSLADYLASKLTDLFATPPAEPSRELAGPVAPAALAELSEQQLLDLLAEQLDAPQPLQSGAHERS